MAIAPGLYPRLGYDPVKDLAPVTQVLSTPLILTSHPSLPVRSVRALVALARAKPNTITYASGGTGGAGPSGHGDVHHDGRCAYGAHPL